MPASSRFSSTLPEHQQRQNASGDYQRSAGCDTKRGTNLGQTLIGLLVKAQALAASIATQLAESWGDARSPLSKIIVEMRDIGARGTLSKVIDSLAAGYPFSIVHL